jgi:hypothetical protein
VSITYFGAPMAKKRKPMAKPRQKESPCHESDPSESPAKSEKQDNQKKLVGHRNAAVRARCVKKSPALI